MNFLKNLIRQRFYREYIGRYDYGAESLTAMNIVGRHTMSTPIDMATLYELVIHLDRYQIIGDMIECGVWKGGSAGIMALAHLRTESSERRIIRLFDLYDDIVAPDPTKDAGRAVEEVNAYLSRQNKSLNDFQPGAILKGIYDGHGGHGRVEIVRELLVDTIGYPADKIDFRKGLFQDTVPAASDIGKIALLRLDGDWYDSIRIPLDHFYDRVVAGGVVIVDDYWTYEGCKQAVDSFFEERGLKQFKCYSRPQTRFFFKM